MTIGQQIRQRRESLGLSRPQLGEEAGLNPLYLYQVESGRRRPSLDALERLASALKCRLTIRLSKI